LRDVVDACDELAPFLHDKTLEDFLSDNGLRRITERLLEIVGEAMGQAIKHNPDLVNQIPNARAVVGMRNWLIHAYPDIDHPMVWETATSDVSALAITVRTLLADVDKSRSI
jgi:uncharacterized protein with HEPN domain